MSLTSINLLASNRRVVNAAIFNARLLISSVTAGLVCAAVKSLMTINGSTVVIKSYHTTVADRAIHVSAYSHT